MEIISLKFVFFVLTTFIIYHLIPRKYKKTWLLLTSVFFYLSLDIRYVIVMIVLGLVNYLFARQFLESKKNREYINCAIVIDLLSLGLLKILTGNFQTILFGFDPTIQSGWVLPVGFSFYILQLISFQLDIKNTRIAKMPSLLDFSLFVAYFPKILSGPIEKPKTFFEKMDAPKLVDNQAISHGFGLIGIGILRKLLIANFLFAIMPNWHQDAHQIGWSQVFGYVIFVYNDFAGYTSIVRGVSCFFGIELSPNFSQPFLSRNFSEFWNRWHISLSTWLKETIFFPFSRKLNRNSGNLLAICMAMLAPPLATMLISGFWHGASIAMMLWGGLQGILLIGERILYDHWPKLRPQSLSGFGNFISTVLVFILFSLSMVPFAANSAKYSLIIWAGLFTNMGIAMNKAVLPVLILGGFSFLLDVVSQRAAKETWWEDLKMIPRAAIVAFGLFFIIISLILTIINPSKVFIYQGF